MIKIISIQILIIEVCIVSSVHSYNFLIFLLLNVCILFYCYKYKFVESLFIARIECPSIQS